MKKLLIALLALWALPAFAADLPTKVRPFAALTTTPLMSPCSVAACTGFHVDVNIYGSGTGLNVLDLAQLNAFGTTPSLGVGYQYYDGQYWLGARADVGYDMMNGTGLNNLSGVQVVELGGNLFKALGVAPPQTTGFLSMLTSAIPTADIGVKERGKATGMAVGATLHYFLASAPVEIRGGYLNVNYGTTAVDPGTNVTIENIAWAGLAYHF